MQNKRLLLSIFFGMSLVLLPVTGWADLLQISYPLESSMVSSSFGIRNHPIRGQIRHHDGVDLPAPYGSSIQAVDPGRVIFAGAYGGYGNLVVISHTDSLTSHYGHCALIDVSVGQLVQAGQVLGTVGSTGLSTGPHLHFEIRQKGKPVNPEIFFPAFSSSAEG